jgi:hypothetical protein
MLWFVSTLVKRVLAAVTNTKETNVAKYYIQSGSLQLIYSTNKSPFDAAITALWEANEHDTIDEYFYIDERGMRGYTNADKDTIVIPSEFVLDKAGWKY